MLSICATRQQVSARQDDTTIQTKMNVYHQQALMSVVLTQISYNQLLSVVMMLQIAKLQKNQQS